MQPGADHVRIGLVGYSAGGIEVYDVLSRHHDLEAGVVDSRMCSRRPSAITTPMLVLGGTADDVVPVAQQWEAEQELRAAGRVVESHYYEGIDDGVIFDPQVSGDATTRTIQFLDRYLTS